MSPAKRTCIAFLATVMLMPGVYLAFRPTMPVHAQIPGIELLSLGNIAQWVGQAIFMGLETAVYKTIKSLAKSLAHKMVETALTEFATGKKGQEPFWSTKSWEKEMKDIGGKFLSFGLQGMAQGFEKGFNRSKKEAMTADAAKQDEVSTIQRSNANSYTASAKGCTGEGAVCNANVNGFKMDKQGNATGEAGEAWNNKGSKEYLENQAKASGLAADKSAEKAKNIRSQVSQIEKNEKKRQEADRRGREGGTSPEVAAVIGLLCNPNQNPNISLKISLGIGSLGEDPDEEPLCNVNDLAKNWTAMYDKFRTFDPSEESKKAWGALSNLFDTDSSDLGVAFNANSAFYDVHTKQTAQAALDAFIQRIVPPGQEDEAGNIKTPGDVVRASLQNSVLKGEENASDPAKAMTGKMAADAADIVGTFVDSLLSKGMDYLKQGMVRNVKAWQAASQEKEVNKLASALDQDAQLKAARDAAEAARARARVVQVRLEEAQNTATLAREMARAASSAPPVERQRLEAAATQAETVVTTTQTELQQAQETVRQADAQVTAVATAPRVQSVNPAQAAVMDALYNPNASPSSGGIAAVRQYTASLTRVSGVDGGVMDILAQLRSTECSTSPNACVAGDAFANAIQQRMTVKEAVEAFKKGENAGLNPDGVFGFETQPKPRVMSQAIQPAFQTNFPYNSLVILRKYRVVPVSWELAALYIRDHSNACGSGTSCTLQYMLDKFDVAPTPGTPNPFFRLVDPNWVLKLPSMYCAVKGYGPIQEKTKDTEQTLCKNDTNGDGKVCCSESCLTPEEKTNLSNDSTNKNEYLDKYLDYEETTVVRPEVCLDEQSCLEDDATGKCKPKMYGYCLEEKKLWRFNGTQCNPIYASCDEFVDKNTQAVSYYLKDSVQNNPACSQDTAGCAWYSNARFVGAARTTGTTGNFLVKDWDSAVSHRAYLTPKAPSCSDKAEGCRGVVDVSGTLEYLEYTEKPRAILIANASWYPAEPNPTWQWLKDNNYFSSADTDFTLPADQLAAKNYDIYIVDRYAWGVGDASQKAYDLWKIYGKNVITIGNDSSTNSPYPITGSMENTGYASTPSIQHSITNPYRTAANIGDYGDTGNIITSVQPEFQVLYRKTGDSSKITGIIGESEKGGVWFHDQTGKLFGNENGQGVLVNVLKYIMGKSAAARYVKIAPDYLQCNDPNNTATITGTTAPFSKPSYRREECKPYALHCAQEYVGCELYTPQEAGGFPIAATGPQTGCKAACAGLTNYSMQKTRIEYQLGLATTTVSAAFIPASPTVQQCSAADVGCDEFTNILAGAEAEKRDYFKEIRRCEKKPAKPEDVTIFYSPMGANVGGYRLDIFTVKADSHGAPACFGSEACDCSGDGAQNDDDEEAYYNQFLNPNTTTINCRQLYVNRDDSGYFEPEYYHIDKLIYLTDDCKEYRRTLDGDGGVLYGITPSLSRQCPSSSARCREFRDPTAGNVVMVNYSNFEDNTAQGWSAYAGSTQLSIGASNESESLGNHSLEMKENTAQGAITFEKNGVLLLGNVSYLAGLNIKTSLEVDVKIDLLGYENKAGQPVMVTSATQSVRANRWQYLTFSFAKLTDVRPTVQGNSGIRITVTPKTGILSSVLLDSITIKQADGVIYAVDDSWVLPDECVSDSQDKTTADPAQIGCTLYADRTGAQAVFKTVERLCPNEMIGCKAYTQNSVPLYVVEDASKVCAQEDNGCTAYGAPTLDLKGDVIQRTLSTDTKTEDWITRYVKVTPEQARSSAPDTSNGVCSQNSLFCRAYTVAGQQDTFFKDPGNKICQWRAVKEEEIHAIEDASTVSAEQKSNAIANLKTHGMWYYRACETRQDVACNTDADCAGIGAGTCNEKTGLTCSGNSHVLCNTNNDCSTLGFGTCNNPCGSGANPIPKVCPSNQKTCRKITDPECQAQGTLKSDYGRGTPSVACQQEYYYLADVQNKGECNGKVDVEGGCLLFNDANAGALKYTTNNTASASPSGYYPKYFQGGFRGVPVNNTDAWNATATNDANALLKVRLDRMCKTWLECADYITQGDKTICTQRVPCIERGVDGVCSRYIFKEAVEYRKTHSANTHTYKRLKAADDVLTPDTFSLPTSATAAIPFAMLSGMSRPDLQFSNEWKTRDVNMFGHNTLFGWNQNETGLSSQLYLAVASGGSEKNVVNSCRVRPRSDAPDERYKSYRAPGNKNLISQGGSKFFVNSCNFENKKGDAYTGVDGYCIEPYPQFTDEYFSGNPSAVPAIAAAHADNASFGFKSACLNWYPADRTATRLDIGSGGGNVSLTATPVTTALAEQFSDDDIYFCAEFGVREQATTTLRTVGTSPEDIVVTVPAIGAGSTAVFLPAIGREVIQNQQTYAPSTLRKDKITEFTINSNAQGTTNGRVITPSPANPPSAGAAAYVQTTNNSGFPKTYTGNLTTKGGDITDAPTSTVTAILHEACLTDKTPNGLSVPTGGCTNGTQKEQIIKRIDKVLHHHIPDGQSDRTEFVTAPDSGPTNTGATNQDWYTFETVRAYRAFVTGGGSECKTPSDTDLPDKTWGEGNSGFLKDNNYYNFSGFVDVEDLTETDTYKIKSLAISGIKELEWGNSGHWHDITGWQNNGYDTDEDGDRFVDVRPKYIGSGNRTFDGWNISTKGWKQVIIKETVAHMYRPACSDGKVDLPELSRIDKVTTASGWECYGGYNDTWDGRACKYVSSIRTGNQTNGAYSENGQEGRTVTQEQAYYSLPRIDRVTSVTKNKNGQEIKDVRFISTGWPGTATSAIVSNTSGMRIETCPATGICPSETSRYADAQPRKDTVHYFEGESGSAVATFIREGSVETATQNCATSYSIENNQSCALTPTSEINADEADVDGNKINIERRNSQNGKDAYSMTAQAVYKDIYCKRIIHVAKSGFGSVPFFTKLSTPPPEWKGKQLSNEQVAALDTGPIILKREIKKWWWEGSKPESDSRRFGYSISELAAKMYNGKSNIKPYKITDTLQTAPVSDLDGLLSNSNFSFDWTQWETYKNYGVSTDDYKKIFNRPDREKEAIKIAMGSSGYNIQNFSEGKYDGTPHEVTSGLLPPFMCNLPCTQWNISLASYNNKITSVKNPVFDYLASRSIHGSESNGTNINIADFNYANPSIPFTRVYDDRTSSGVSGATGKFSTTTGAVAPRWFPASASPRPVNYPFILNATGTPGSFTFEKAVTGAKKIGIKFYIDTNNDQLPLRTLNIDWGDGEDGSNLQKIQRDGGDGRGISELPWSVGATAFEMNHVFVDERERVNHTICIEVMDNWERSTRVCGDLNCPASGECKDSFSGALRVLHKANKNDATWAP
jgi:hypothetical protein